MAPDEGGCDALELRLEPFLPVTTKARQARSDEHGENETDRRTFWLRSPFHLSSQTMSAQRAGIRTSSSCGGLRYSPPSSVTSAISSMVIDIVPSMPSYVAGQT